MLIIEYADDQSHMYCNIMAWEEWGTFSVLEVVSKEKIDEFNVVVHYILVLSTE